MNTCGVASACYASRVAAVDHLVYAAPSLEQGIALIERRLGVRMGPGGRHPQWGTHNALLSLGDGVYAEVFAPHHEAPAPPRPRPLGLDTIDAPRLAAWVARVDDVPAAVRALRRAGVELGEPVSGRRRRPDGVELAWTQAGLDASRMDGALPFLIDWGVTPHPSASAPPGGRLAELRIEHPEPDRVREALRALGAVGARGALGAMGIGVAVAAAPSAGLVAAIDSPLGRVELR